MTATVRQLRDALMAQTAQAADRKTRLPARVRSWLEVARTEVPRVIVVDDDPLMRSVIARLLGGRCETTTCSDASAALELLRHEEFDLVVADVSMPGMLGVDLVRELRRSSMRPLVPVLLISGASGQDLAEFARRCGANAWLMKPFDVEEMRDIVANLTEQK